MKGCGLSLLVSLLGYAAVSGAISFGLTQYGLAPGDTWGPALIGGFFGWVAGNLLISSAQSLRERAALRNGMAGSAPVDGRQAVLIGQIEPIGLSLKAPFSGKECVAYRFEIWRMVSGFRRATKVVYVDGINITPSTIITRAGSYRLLAVPELDCPETSVPGETARRLAAEYLAMTTLEPPPAPFTRPALERQWSDDDGGYRRDARRVLDEPNLVECTLSEWQIERGARVSVFGQYSEARRAIVADPNDWSKMTRVMKGEPDALMAQLRTRAIGRLVFGVIAAAAMAGVIAAFVPASA